MDKSTVTDRVREIIYRTTNIKPEGLSAQAKFKEDLDLDSLTLMEIAVNIDQEFNLDLPEEAFDQLTCVQAIVEMIETHFAERVA